MASPKNKKMAGKAAEKKESSRYEESEDVEEEDAETNNKDKPTSNIQEEDNQKKAIVETEASKSEKKEGEHANQCDEEIMQDDPVAIATEDNEI